MNILFDLDGTLMDPREGIVRCLQHALRRLGAEPRKDLEQFIGIPLRETFVTLLESEDPELVKKAVAAYRQRFAAQGYLENEVYPGMTRVLDGLADPLWVATSKPTVYADRILRHFRLRSYFGGVYGSELSGALSDKSELVGHLLEIESLNDARSVMIGDRGRDVEAAHDHGLCAIGVLWGYGPRHELETAGADLLADEPDDLPVLIDQLRG